MRKSLLAACFVLLAFPAAAGWNVKDMNAFIDETNFVVNSGCSGTLVDLENRYVLTADHCVKAQYETVTREKIDDDGIVTEEKVRRVKPGTVKQISFDGPALVREVTYRTKLIKTDAKADLALLQIISDIPHKQAAVLACEEPVRGEEVYIVGNPMGVLYSSVVRGIVSSLQRTYDLLRFGDDVQGNEPLMQISGGVIGGNSGGSVYNADGELIGVPVAASPKNEVLGFAVPLDVVRDFLDKAKSKAANEHCES